MQPWPPLGCPSPHLHTGLQSQAETLCQGHLGRLAPSAAPSITYHLQCSWWCAFFPCLRSPPRQPQPASGAQQRVCCPPSLLRFCIRNTGASCACLVGTRGERAGATPRGSPWRPDLSRTAPSPCRALSNVPCADTKKRNVMNLVSTWSQVLTRSRSWAACPSGQTRRMAIQSSCRAPLGSSGSSTKLLLGLGSC